MLKIGLLTLVLTQMTGCSMAFGKVQDYLKARPELTFSGHNKVAVGVYDQRPAVLDKSVDPDYVGMLRAALGNPYDVKTSSKKPLADDMAGVLADALRKKGAQANTFSLTPTLKREQAISKLLMGKPDKVLLLTLRDWESDMYSNLELRYDFDLQVYGRNGKILASKSSKGTEILTQKYSTKKEAFYEGPPATFKEKIEDAYKGQIARALEQSSDDPVAEHAAGNDKYGELEKLKKLLDDGALTQAEFALEKQKILSAE